MTELPAAIPADSKKEKEKIRTDNLLRETSTNYVRLIGDADRKARIMLVVNSVFLSVGLTLLTKMVQEIPYAWISVSILLAANALTLYFSVLSVNTELKNAGDTGIGNNMLHYKKCRDVSWDDYRAGMREALMDEDKKLDAMIHDLYYYGNLLALKYRMLKIAYRLFSWGIVLAVMAYVLTLLFVNQ